LFLDEPTTGLDPQSRIDLWEMIEGLVEEGTTVLLTTQYLEEADRLARRVAVVDHGHVIAEGTPAQLKSDLGTTVLDVGMADPELARRAAQVLGEVDGKTPTVEGSIVELPVDEGPRVAIEVLRRLDQHELVPTTFRLREPSLDDVFLALTGRRTDVDGGESASDRGRRRRAARVGSRADQDGENP
jgi:ABC-type multidrug transport system ATPase subunit